MFRLRLLRSNKNLTLESGAYKKVDKVTNATLSINAITASIVHLFAQLIPLHFHHWALDQEALP